MSFPKYPEYKDSGVEWLAEVPQNWDVKRLGYYFVERREKVSDVDYEPLSVTKMGIVPQLETAAKTDDNDNRKKVCAGDFVINSRSDRKGSSGLSDRDGSVSLINTVLCPREDILGIFAHHLFRSIPFQEEFYRYGKGIVADLWSTNYSEMKSIVLAIPPLPEQSAIATVLDRETAKIDALVAEQEKLIELLKEKRQAVISHAVTKGLDPNVPMKDSGVEWLGEVPEHWGLLTIGHASEFLSYGFTNPMPTTDIGPYMLTANDIGYGYINYENARSTSQEALESLTDKSKPISGDILITKDGTLGRVAIHDGKKCCINQSVAILRVTPEKLLPEFLATALLGSVYQEKMIFDAGGTTIKHIYISRLSKMLLAVPPIKEQYDILKYLNYEVQASDQLIAESQRAIDLLKERRSALISAAVTGKIDVRGLADATQ